MVIHELVTVHLVTETSGPLWLEVDAAKASSGWKGAQLISARSPWAAKPMGQTSNFVGIREKEKHMIMIFAFRLRILHIMLGRWHCWFQYGRPCVMNRAIGLNSMWHMIAYMQIRWSLHPKGSRDIILKKKCQSRARSQAHRTLAQDFACFLFHCSKNNSEG